MTSLNFHLNDLIRVLGFTTIYTALGLLLPVQGYISPAFALGTVLTGVLYGLVLWYASLYLPVSRKVRILVIWIAVYVIQMLNPVLEGFFFSTQFEGHPELIFGAVIFGTILTLPTALAAGFLFQPKGALKSFKEMRANYFGGFSRNSLALRLIVSSVLWMGIYFVFGSLVGPIVLPYYTVDGVGYSLTLPSIEIVLLLQTFRGFIYVFSVLPLVMALDTGKKPLALILTALLYIGGALAVFIISDQFPLFLRMVHGIELFADSLFAGLAISYLLGRTQKN
ncbi:MAG: hypothetical protein ACFFEF_08655 [Candidatus Thorarchaeota archaeon]